MRSKKIAIIVISLLGLGTIIGVLFTINRNPSVAFKHVNSVGNLSELIDEDYMEKLNFESDIQYGDIDFSLLPDTSDEIIRVSWDLHGEIYRFNRQDEALLLNYTIEKSNGSTTIKLNSYLHDRVSKYIFDNGTIQIAINPNFDLYSFNLFQDEANLDFSTQKFMAFDNFNVISNSGEIELLINETQVTESFNLKSNEGKILFICDHTEFFTDLSCHSNSGEIQVNFWNIIFNQSSIIDIQSNSEFVGLRWAQHTQKNNNVSINLESAGNVYCYFWALQEFQRTSALMNGNDASYFASITTGVWTEVEPNLFHTINYADDSLDEFHFNVTSRNNRVYMKIVDCFKPRRFCGREESWINPTETTGHLSIPLSNFTGTEVIINNQTTNANLTFHDLDVGSDSALEFDWDLVYNQGGNHGLGDICVEMEWEVILDQLHVEIFLVYEEDRIRPIFIGGGIQVSLHPTLTLLS